LALTLLASAATFPALSQQPAFQPGVESPDIWPAGPGREETFYQCTACHATGLITRIGMTRAQWNDIIDQMVAKHTMTQPEPADRATYLDYLSTAFPPRAPQQGGGNWRNPFQPQR
jgi:hypothetical protein